MEGRQADPRPRRPRRGDAAPSRAALAAWPRSAARTASRRSAGRSSQATSGRPAPRPRLRRRSKESSGRARLRERSRRAGGDLGQAGVGGADTGSTPHAAASAATIPKASGNVLGTTWASQAGSRSASSPCSRRPTHVMRSEGRAAAVGALGRRLGLQAVEERAQVAQRRRAARPRRRGPPPAMPGPRPGRGRPARAPGARAPLGRRRSRRAPAGPPGTRARTSGQAATSRSMPLETISLPTKITSRPLRPRRARRSPPRRRRGRGRRRSGRLVGAAAAACAARSRPSATSSAAAPPGRAGGTPATSTPGGPSRVRAAASGLGAPPTGSRPCGASRRARRGPREALARVGQEAGGVRLDRVLERAAVDLHREGIAVGQRPREDRGAHDQVVGQRDLDRARARRRRGPRSRCAAT